MSETATAAPAAQQAAPSATFGFVKLIVDDLDAMVEFYDRALGLVAVQTVDLPDLTEKILRKRGTDAGPAVILYRHKDGRELTLGNAWGPVGFYVRDVEAAYAHAVAQGAAPHRPPYDAGAMQVAFVLDPEGHEIELVSMKR
jgi:catechol 2,3-dioxygenase-like lactoylglutathione lyase family enzyme